MQNELCQKAGPQMKGNSMRKCSVQPMGARSAPKAVVAVLWIAALGVPAFTLYSRGVDNARREGENTVLKEVAARIGSPTIAPENVYDSILLRRTELNDIEYVHAAKRLGISMDWRSLISQIQQCDKAEQVRAAQVIAEVCGLGPDITLDEEQMILGKRMASLPGTAPKRAVVD